MPVKLNFPLSSLLAFLAVLARVSGALAFVPLPGFRQGPQPARVVLALAMTVVLYPSWPSVEPDGTPWRLISVLVLEAAVGIGFGLMASFLAEAFQLAAQAVGLQAGYAYASMVDPQTQADSGILLILAQLAAGLLFFAFGLDREVIRAFARSLETIPPGAWFPSGAVWEALARTSAAMFTTGVRLALPVLALLALTDLALALLGRVNAQLQLLTLSFPLKMLAALVAMAALAPVFVRVLGSYAGQVSSALRVMAGG
ncbi:MAG: flagellar biosynthetic protein FliR [Bryobacteraceae bacterium]|nr:flagellar biosynthetic protein FliR [Bryobacteraceae bacterium]